MSAMADDRGTLIGYLRGAECPRRGGYHVVPVRLSTSPPCTITARVGVHPEAEVTWCGCDYGLVPV